MAKNKNTEEKSTKKKIDIKTVSDKEITDSAQTVNDGNDRNGQRVPEDGSAPADKKAGSAENAAKNEDAQADSLNNAQTAIAAEKDKYLRLAAEYDNFRKRSAKERESSYSNAKADTISKLLPVFDNLERALKQECSDEAYAKGIEMIMQQLTVILKDMGVSPIPTVGEPFNPNLHNAVMRIENPGLGEGIISEECQKGFTLGEKVIRHSSVVVAN